MKAVNDEFDKKIKQKKRQRFSFVKIGGLVLSVAFLVFFGFENVSAQFAGKKIKWIEAESSWRGVLISWGKNEYLSETENLVLVRKKNICPKNIFDGEEIYRGNGSFFEDKTTIKGEKYCYGVGILELSGNSSDFKVSQLAENLSLRTSLLLKLKDGLNLVIFLETMILSALVIFSRIKKRQKIFF